MKNLIQRAAIFADEAHRGQVRKYSGLPYIVHPAQVSATIALFLPDNEELIAAAWLHDVVEDTAVMSWHIEEEFGIKVGDLVAEVTNVSRPSDGNRYLRKKIDMEFLSQVSPWAQTLKLADLICNTRSIVAENPKFAPVYLAEKRALLKVLTGGHRGLWAIASGMAK